jgi:hypothetical protein
LDFFLTTIHIARDNRICHDSNRKICLPPVRAPSSAGLGLTIKFKMRL